MEDRQLELFDEKTDKELRNPVTKKHFFQEDERVKKTEKDQEREEAIKFLSGMPMVGEKFANTLFERLHSWYYKFHGIIIPERLERFIYYPYRLPSVSDYRFSNLAPGSLQLLRTLPAERKVSELTATRFVTDLEQVCEGEPMIGMELYPSSENRIEHIEAVAGASALNFLRDKYKITFPLPFHLKLLKELGVTIVIEDENNSAYSFYDGSKWNYRPMPTYHPIFAMLMKELRPYIPKIKPVSYMLCVGDNMEGESTVLLSAWLLSHPETSMLAHAMKRTGGDIDFPGIYLGQRFDTQWGQNVVELSIGKDKTQTNFYGGIMYPELPDAEEFIHMSGILSSAYKKRPAYFKDFKIAFHDTLKELGLKESVIPVVKPRDLDAKRKGKSFPELAGTARNLPIDISDYIRGKVWDYLYEIERALYRKEELDLINRAYSGQVI